MLGNKCEKMVVIPGRNNEWPEQILVDDQKVPMGSSGAMEKPASSGGNQVVQEQQNQSLRCPRCDSSNTKFCYYNNYSLSQPRHFCKSCKRYWTRGGTLRNVPVGGGCRKNKRLKRHQSQTQTPSSASNSDPLPLPPPPSSHSQPHILDTNPNPNNPLFYSSDITLNPFPRFNSAYDHHLLPHLNALGLSGFPSNNTNDTTTTSTNTNHNTLVSSYNSIFANSSSMASLLISPTTTTTQQQKVMNINNDGVGNLMKEDASAVANNNTNSFQGLIEEQVKVEQRQNQIMDHTTGGGGLVSDFSPYYWNPASSANWTDQTNNVGLI